MISCPQKLSFSPGNLFWDSFTNRNTGNYLRHGINITTNQRLSPTFRGNGNTIISGDSQMSLLSIFSEGGGTSVLRLACIRLIWQQNRNVRQLESAQKGLNATSGAPFSSLWLVIPVVWFACTVVNWRSRSVAKSVYYHRRPRCSVSITWTKWDESSNLPWTKIVQKSKYNKTKLTYVPLTKRFLVFPGRLKWHFVDFCSCRYYPLKKN